MPAPRKHKSKKAQLVAVRDKNKRYYTGNRDRLLSKKRSEYNEKWIMERKERKADSEEQKRAAWEIEATTEYESLDSLSQLRAFKERVNRMFIGSGSNYFERLYHEYLAHTKTDPVPYDQSPLEVPSKVFSSMTDTVAKIGNAILNDVWAT
ncbi:hypothetical protein V5O48_014729 [Marasmius crinis-equi]|uniref:Uncharacterized protein n=1 Tax=Marasmius crinis-equi TaxID=585013 RepID=A0ABR3EWK8_9AGAR